MIGERTEEIMTLLEAIDARHSVRAYTNQRIPEEVRKQLDDCVRSCNEESGLDITIQYDDPAGFDSRMASYGSFRNVSNYIVLKGRKIKDFEYLCGYFGEKIVLYAQQLGLNTCWVALTFNKKRVKEIVPKDETLCMVISLGYGETQGKERKSKTAKEVSECDRDMPIWFREGIDAALKAPTATNQQKFIFTLKGDTVTVRTKGIGIHTKTDLGIVAYHFEAASGRQVKQVYTGFEKVR